MIARQQKREDIIAGIHESAAARISALAKQIRIKAPLMMTGGVAKNIGMLRALESRLDEKLHVESLSQETGAVGAAVQVNEFRFRHPQFPCLSHRGQDQ